MLGVVHLCSNALIDEQITSSFEIAEAGSLRLAGINLLVNVRTFKYCVVTGCSDRLRPTDLTIFLCKTSYH
jgi:hypothetical protein